jgi:2-methylcitrate dehydratase PrpD
MSLTAELGAFVAAIRYDTLPAEALPIVRTGFTDAVGVMLVGTTEPVTGIVRQALAVPTTRPEARACLSNLLLTAADAALLGGTAAHAIDYDDQSLTGHPSAVLVPAILAEGERLDAGGPALVTAYVAGYEVWAELVRRDTGYHRKGWHPTGVFGVIGAAAACAVLNRLPAERASTALAIAASHAGGMATSFGSTTKPYHAGRAARDGVVAVRLAAAGMTAGRDAFEHAQGFLTAFSPGTPDRESPVRLGREWYMPRQGLCIKLYPTCYFMHRPFEAAVNLLAGRGIGPTDIAEVSVTIGRGEADVLFNHRPRTANEARFSAEFAMAAAVILGRMGVAELSDAVVQRADMGDFYSKVRIDAIDQRDPREPAMAPYTSVRIRLVDGTVLDSLPVSSIHGHAWDPVTAAEHWTKFQECTARTHSEAAARNLFDMLQQVETLASARALPTAAAVFAGAG